MKKVIGRISIYFCDCCGKKLKSCGRKLAYLLCDTCHSSKVYVLRQKKINNLSRSLLFPMIREKTEQIKEKRRLSRES